MKHIPVMIGLVLAMTVVIVMPDSPALCFAQENRDANAVTDSTIILKEIMAIPAKGIPRNMFQKAEGVACFPNMIKGGFVVGIRRGHGTFIVKNKDGLWEYPRFATLTGGSVGFQVGVQSADVILVFCSRRSVEAALAGRFTVGADANVAAGPVGRQTSASTDILLTSEIYSWSKSRGIFLGVSLDGCVMEINPSEANSYYMNGIPDDAKKLVQLIAEYASPQQTVDPPAQSPTPPPSQPVTPNQPVQPQPQSGLIPLPSSDTK